MLREIKSVFGLLDLRERNKAGLLVLLILVSGIIDVVGVSSIMPFIAVLSNPELLYENKVIASYLGFLKITDENTALIYLGITVFLILICSLCLKAATQYALLQFSIGRESSIGKRMIEGYLQQPYEYFLMNTSSDIGKNILSEINMIIHQSVVPLFNFLAYATIVITFLIVLIWIDPYLAMIIGMVVGGTYLFISLFFHGLLKKFGATRFQANQERFKIVSEAFNAIKEIKLRNLEASYVSQFANSSDIFVKFQAKGQLISQLPRYILEGIAFGGMILMVLFLLNEKGGFENSLPIITLYALAGYRLMPSIQQIYYAISQLKFSSPALCSLHQNLISLNATQKQEPSLDFSNKFKFDNELRLNDLSFRYQDSNSYALKNIDLVIKAKSTVGIVGRTGSGKSTILDLVLGLFRPSSGNISIDGNALNEKSFPFFQANIGYVPQSIYLSDKSIAQNIAFGEETIDMKRVEEAAKAASLHDFILNESPQQYGTLVGERGVRLSGGQIQRIGIARALYKNPQILLFDEATSALDNVTEKSVMESINLLSGNITIIMIAHRLTTIRNCDQVVFLERGEISAVGSYDYLIKNSADFQNFVTSDIGE